MSCPPTVETLEFGEIHFAPSTRRGMPPIACASLLQSERLLFTGDHVLGGVSPVILPPDGDMAAYLNSLDKLRASISSASHRATATSCRTARR